MTDNVFYAKGRNKSNQRKVVVTTPQLLIGKAPTKQKRVKMRMTMPLSGQKAGGTPEWVAAAHEFVAKNHDKVTLDVDFKGMDISFPVDSLFAKDGVIAVSKCQMRGFAIEEQGEADDPDVVMVFVVYAPFSTPLWEFLGQMAGDEVTATFEQSAPEEDLELTTDEGDEEFDEDDEPDAAQASLQ